MLVNLRSILTDGFILALLASVLINAIQLINPRIFLQDYPAEIQARVMPKTSQEKRLSLILGTPFLLLLAAVPFLSTLNLKNSCSASISFFQLFFQAFGVEMIFNLVDWLILDWLIFCTWTPKFIVIPGTEGSPEYKDYWFHFRGFLIGTGISAASALIIAGVVMLI